MIKQPNGGLRIGLARGIWALVSGLCLLAPSAFADKIDVSIGGFSFEATNARNKSSKTISGFGSYRLGYRRTFMDHYEFDISYSLVATEVIGGDLSFGLDAGVNYYPFSVPGDIEADSGKAFFVLQSLWRPFVGGFFSQRSFQSVSSQYAGMGLKFGTEYQYNEKLSVIGVLRYFGLSGPSGSEATQIDILLGGVVQF